MSALRSVRSSLRLLRPSSTLVAASRPVAAASRPAFARALSTGHEDLKQRAYVRPKTSADPNVLLDGRIFTDREWEYWYKYEAKMTWSQWLVSKQILSLMVVRNSFIHGTFRRLLTIMAVYAAGAEFLHDFFHHHPTIHHVLGLLGTEHAVGFIALSHLSEHFKEYLEEQDKPPHHEVERARQDCIRIFMGEPQPTWPRHILMYQKMWEKVRYQGVNPIELGLFPEANVALMRAELAAADKGSHHH